MEEIVKFEVEDIEKYIDDADPELAIAEIKFLSTRPNSHQINITEDILKKDASTILGKFLIGKMNILNTDSQGHETDESIFGYFPKDQSIQFQKESGGFLSASAKAVISKLYANDYYNMFIDDNSRAVSVEMTTTGVIEYPDGSSDIDDFNITGCTTLGHGVNPSCTDAEMSIIQFSEKKANKFYHDTMNDIKMFAETRRAKLAEDYKSHPVDISKDAVDMGNWNGEKAKKDLLKEKNFDSVGKKVCLDFQGGDRILANCKYPVMNIKNGKWVYNANGLSSALAYGEQHDKTVANKVIAIQKKLGLDKKKEGKASMAIQGRKAWGDVIAQVEKHEGGHVYVDSVKKDKVIYTTKDGVRYDVGAVIDAKADDKTVKAKIDWGTKKKSDDQSNIRKFDEDSETFEDEETFDDETTFEDKATFDDDVDFSTDANVDAAAMAQMLDNEAQKNTALAKQLDEKDNVIMCYEKELGELRKFKDDCLEKEKMETVNSTLAKVKDKMSDGEYAKCEADGKDCKFEDVQAWKNSVLANVAENVLFSDNARNTNHVNMSIFHDDAEDTKGIWDIL